MPNENIHLLICHGFQLKDVSVLRRSVLVSHQHSNHFALSVNLGSSSSLRFKQTANEVRRNVTLVSLAHTSTASTTSLVTWTSRGIERIVQHISTVLHTHLTEDGESNGMFTKRMI